MEPFQDIDDARPILTAAVDSLALTGLVLEDNTCLPSGTGYTASVRNFQNIPCRFHDIVKYKKVEYHFTVNAAVMKYCSGYCIVVSRDDGLKAKAIGEFQENGERTSASYVARIIQGMTFVLLPQPWET